MAFLWFLVRRLLHMFHFHASVERLFYRTLFCKTFLQHSKRNTLNLVFFLFWVMPPHSQPSNYIWNAILNMLRLFKIGLSWLNPSSFSKIELSRLTGNRDPVFLGRPKIAPRIAQPATRTSLAPPPPSENASSAPKSDWAHPNTGLFAKKGFWGWLNRRCPIYIKTDMEFPFFGQPGGHLRPLCFFGREEITNFHHHGHAIASCWRTADISFVRFWRLNKNEKKGKQNSELTLADCEWVARGGSGAKAPPLAKPGSARPKGEGAPAMDLGLEGIRIHMYANKREMEKNTHP